ncbi:hypothetical protein EDD21DRAFT_421837, partial [Dissophora ornata]
MTHVICASFVEDRIASVRYVWDNASVLKMVKLIGSRHSWPIVAETQVDALRSPSRFRLNPFGNATAVAGSRAQKGISQIFSSPPTSPLQRTAAEQQKKGHPALTSTVFSQFKNAPFSGRNGHDNENDSQQRSNAPLSPSTSDDSLSSKGTSSPPHSNNNGHLQASAGSSRQEQQQQLPREEERGAGWRPDYVKPKGHPAMTSTLFSYMKKPTTNQQSEDDSSLTARRERTLRNGDNEESIAISNRPSREEQQQQKLKQEEEEERGAGWRPDYVKPK